MAAPQFCPGRHGMIPGVQWEPKPKVSPKFDPAAFAVPNRPCPLPCLPVQRDPEMFPGKCCRYMCPHIIAITQA